MILHRCRPFAVTTLVTGAALALAACGGEASTPSSQSPGSTAATPTSATSSPLAPSPLALAQGLTGDDGTAATRAPGPSPDTTPRSAPTADPSVRAALTLTQIRVGRHDDKDRVVFEFGGTGTPGYSAAYVDAPSQQGSGRPLDVPGQAFLQVSMTGQALPMETGLTEVAPGTVQAQNVPGIAGVTFGGQFEGTGQAVIGVNAGKRAFTAFLLENPTRLVVDLDG